MKEDLPRPAPHLDFLHCLDRNHIRCKTHIFTRQQFSLWLLLTVPFCSVHAARRRRGFPLHSGFIAAADGRPSSGWVLFSAAFLYSSPSASFVQDKASFFFQALEIQNLYKISVETQLQCLECRASQTRNSHLLSLPLHIKEDQNSLVSFLMLFNSPQVFPLQFWTFLQKKCMSSFFEEQELRGIDCCFCAQCETKTPSRQVRTGFSSEKHLYLHPHRY